MNLLVTIVAWATIVLAVFLLLVKLVSPRQADDDLGQNIAGLVGGAMSVILAGRALGWW